MADATRLLEEAERRLDDALLARARGAWRGGFAAGGRWMRDALADLRPVGRTTPRYATLGVVKYAAALAAALLPVVWAIAAASPWPLLLVVPCFYAAEAQTVFLFPVAIDGAAHPFGAARALTVRAGGTWRVMSTVLPIAAVMLTGGLRGRGFLRSWCVGCLAVLLWYERVR